MNLLLPKISFGSQVHALIIFLCTVLIMFVPLDGLHGKESDKSLITKDLGLWNVPKGNDIKGWYRVKDQVLELRSGTKRKHSVLKTKANYGNFFCSFEFLFVDGNIDSGIELRNNDQIQIGISGSLKKDMTGSPYIPGLGYPKHAQGVANLLKQKDWNKMTIKCNGPRYIVTLQGKEVVDYISPKAIKEGPVGIQLHGNRDMKIDFRNFRIKSL